MSAKILDGKVLAAQLKEQLSAEVTRLKHAFGGVPRVTSIVIGSDPASLSYVTSQQRAAESLGIHYELQNLKADSTQQDVLDLIAQLNSYTYVHGIIINKPLPAHIDFYVLINAVSPDKDIEGMNLTNLGRLFLGKTKLVPCTPAAAMMHLRSTGVDLRGKEAVVVGRSEIVGKPLALLLLQESITTTICHSATSKAGRLNEHLKAADIVIAAIGKPLFIRGDWIKEGAIVIDVGINQLGDKIVGDVDFSSVKSKAGFITPVPGGVGPVTAVMLMYNALEAFKAQHKN